MVFDWPDLGRAAMHRRPGPAQVGWSIPPPRPKGRPGPRTFRGRLSASPAHSRSQSVSLPVSQPGLRDPARGTVIQPILTFRTGKCLSASRNWTLARSRNYLTMNLFAECTARSIKSDLVLSLTCQSAASRTSDVTVRSAWTVSRQRLNSSRAVKQRRALLESNPQAVTSFVYDVTGEFSFAREGFMLETPALRGQVNAPCHV